MSGLHPPNLRRLHVACGIIEREGCILAAQRGEGMAMALKWEFPGGKIMADETAEECLRRELEEELGVLVTVGHALPPVTHCYPECIVTLYSFVCCIVDGEIVLHEHQDVVWFTIDQIPELDWAEADIPILSSYCQWMSSLADERGPQKGRN